MYVARNNHAGDTAYIILLEYPLEVTRKTQSGKTGIAWEGPNLTYVKCPDPAFFEACEGIQLEPGEGPIKFVLSRLETVGMEALSLKKEEEDDGTDDSVPV